MYWVVILVTSFLLMCHGVPECSAFAPFRETSYLPHDEGIDLWQQELRLKRQVLVEQPQTPEVGDSLENAVFALSGGSTSINCRHASQSGNYVNPTYVWKDGADRTLANPRFITKTTGVLTINDIQPEDSDRYRCELHSHGGGGQDGTFQHQLLPYTMPEFKLTANFIYALYKRTGFGDVEFCLPQNAQTKANELRTQLCVGQGQACIYESEGHCTIVAPGSNEQPQIEVTVIATLSQGYKPPACDALCMKDAIEKQLDEEFEGIANLHSIEKTRLGNTVWTTTQTQTLGVRYEASKFEKTTTHKCEGGYRAYSFICLPCEPGTFSQREAPNCDMCARNHYQDHYAMTECYPCPGSTMTSDTGADNANMCLEAGEMVFMVDVTKEEGEMAGAIAGGVIGTIAVVSCVGIALLVKGPPEIRDKLLRNKKIEKDPEMLQLNNEIRMDKGLPIVTTSIHDNQDPGGQVNENVPVVTASFTNRLDHLIHEGLSKSTIHAASKVSQASRSRSKYGSTKADSNAGLVVPEVIAVHSGSHQGSRQESLAKVNSNATYESPQDIKLAKSRSSQGSRRPSLAKVGSNATYEYPDGLKLTNSRSSHGSARQSLPRVNSDDIYLKPRSIKAAHSGSNHGRSRQSLTRVDSKGIYAVPHVVADNHSGHSSVYSGDSVPSMPPPPVPRTSSSIIRHDEDPLVRAVFSMDVPPVPRPPPLPSDQVPLQFTSSSVYTDSGENLAASVHTGSSVRSQYENYDLSDIADGMDEDDMLASDAMDMIYADERRRSVMSSLDRRVSSSNISQATRISSSSGQRL